MRARLKISFGALALIGLLAAVVVKPPFGTAHASPLPSFALTTLHLTDGSSEPEISIGDDGTLAIVSLQWLFDPSSFGTRLWTGSFSAAPNAQGIVDGALQHPGKSVFGAGDADVDIGSTGRLHAATLIFLVNPTFQKAQFGVSAVTCPSPTSASFSIAHCTEQIIDTTTDDRPWITSDGSHVFISYHDASNASLIHIQRSDDDGFTWKRVGDPIVGQGRTTADATFNNIQGNIVADRHSHNVYAIYAAGVTGVLKARTFTPNQVIVSRSRDNGKTWTPNVAFAAPPATSLAFFFPALAVDPRTGNLYAVWSDGRTVWSTSSIDEGNSWTSAVAVSTTPANTAVLPWVAAYNGAVDVVYYGSSADSRQDPNASWFVYFAQSSGGGFTQSTVNGTSNHLGEICTDGTACGAGTRNLLDLFQVAIDPQNGKTAIIYTDDTLATSNSPNNFACLPNQSPPCPLPQAVLARQQ